MTETIPKRCSFMRGKTFLSCSLASLLFGIGLQAAPPDPVMNGQAEGRSRAVLAQLMAQGDLLETAATARIEGGALRWDFQGREVVWLLAGRANGSPELLVDGRRFRLPGAVFTRLLTQTLQMNPVPDQRLRALIYMKLLKSLGNNIDERACEAIAKYLFVDSQNSDDGTHRAATHALVADEAVAGEIAVSDEAIGRFYACIKGCVEVAGSNSDTVRAACVQACSALLK